MIWRLLRLFWLTALVAHAILAVLWWLLEPGGFPLYHPRFWSNTVAPIATLILAIASLWVLHRDSKVALRILLPIWPAAWLAIAIASRIMFPVSFEWLCLAPAAAASVMGLATIPVYSAQPRAGARGITAIAGSIILSVGAGAALAFTQKVPPPATNPIDTPLSEIEIGAGLTAQKPGAIRLGGNVLVQSSNASMTVPIGRLTLMVEPLLTFSARSPDGCPTVFVRPPLREGASPALRGAYHDGRQTWLLVFEIQGQGPALLNMVAGSEANRFSITVLSRLEQPVYSHLNSFCDIEIRGHRRLSLEFSPCPGVVIDVRPFDYPFGRPARFAFLDRGGTFRVVEASSGEKGPFKALASGKLGRDEALGITLIDEGQKLGKVTLADWALQASTALSPTAGWGVPVNAIEFSRTSDDPGAPASIFVTLAGTSVGRGWDCVGHSAGTYRNRMSFERFDD